MQQDVTAPDLSRPDPVPSRRQVLGGVGAGAAGLMGLAVLTACGGSGSGGGDDGSSQPSSEETTSAATQAAGGTVAAVADVPVGGATVVQFDGKPVVVSLKNKATPAAFSAICPHAGCTVAPQGAKLVCPCHGSVFDSFTGAVQPGSQAKTGLTPITVKISGANIVSG